jgi:hypothetical protein
MVDDSSAPRRAWADGALLAACAAIGLLLRAPDALLLPQFVAEDGTNYFAGQFGRALPQLFNPIQGYLVILSRLVAWVASRFPLTSVPFVYNTCALALAGCSIAWFSLRARALFHPTAAFAVPLLIPIINTYVLDNVVHLQWWTQLPLVAACLLPRPATVPSGAAWRCVEGVCVAIMALNGPYAIFCISIYAMLVAALAVAALLRSRTLYAPLIEYLRSLDPMAVAIGASAGCLSLLLALGAHKVPTPITPEHLAVFIDQVLGEALQVHALGPVFFSRAEFLGVLAALFVAAAFVPRSATHRIACLTLLVYGVLCLSAGYAKSIAVGTPLDAFKFGDTYYIALCVLAWLVLSHVIGVLLRKRIFGAVTVIGTLLLLTILNPNWHVRTDVPDLGWPQYAARIEAGETVDVPLLPSANWHVRISSPKAKQSDKPGERR